MTVHEASRLWNLSVGRVQLLCRTGRVKGAKKVGPMWIVPNNAPKPTFKNGRPRKAPLA